LLGVVGGVLFNEVTWHIYAMVPAFLPLLEALLELTFRHCRGGGGGGGRKCVWISGTPWKHCPDSCSFILGNKKKSQECQSGMYGGWGLDMLLVAKNCCTVKTVCTGALSW